MAHSHAHLSPTPWPHLYKTPQDNSIHSAANFQYTKRPGCILTVNNQRRALPRVRPPPISSEAIRALGCHPKSL